MRPHFLSEPYRWHGAVALAEHAVVGGGTPHAGCGQVDGAGLITGLLLDNLSERLADAGEAGMAEGVYLRRTMTWPTSGRWQPSSDDDDAIVLAVIVVVLEQAQTWSMSISFSGTRMTWRRRQHRGVGDPARRPGPSLQ